MDRDAFGRGLVVLGGVVKGRWVHYYAEEISAWCKVTKRDVETLGAMVRDGVPDAYSLWCGATKTREVKS